MTEKRDKGTATHPRAEKGHPFFHVTHNKKDNKWHVKEARGSDSDLETYDSQDEAEKKAIEHAKKERGYVVYHREDGKFETVDSYL